MLDAAARSLRILMAAMLAANCFMPCYTLAYADDCQEVAAREPVREDKQECPGAGQAHEGPDHQGVLRHEETEEETSLPLFSSTAALNRFRPRSHVLVEASYSLADSLIRLGAVRAFADESQEVDSVVPQEEQKEVPGSSAGLERPSSGGESVPDGADGASAAGGRADGSSTEERAGEGSSGADGRAEGPIVYDVEPSPDFPIVEEGHGGNDDSYGGNEADWGLPDDSENGIMPLASSPPTASQISTVNDTIISVRSVLNSINKQIASSEIGIKQATTTAATETRNTLRNLFLSSIGVDTSADRANFEVNGVKWNTFRGGLAWLLSRMFVNASYMLDQLKALNTESDNIKALLRQQWGYGYGGTKVIEDGSPMAKLSYIKDEQLPKIYDLLVNMNTASLKTMNDNLLVLKNKLTYVQETSLPKINDNVISNGSALSRLFDKLKYVQETSLPTINDNILSGNSFLSRIFDKLNYIQVTSLPTVNDNLLWYRGLFVKDGYTFSFWTLSDISEKIRLLVKSLDDRSALILERLSALDALGVRLSSIGNQLGDIDTSMSTTVKWLEVFHGDLSMLRHGRASISLDESDYTIWDWLHDIDFSLGNVSQLLKGVQETLTAWGNRWDSQDLFLMEWAKRWDELDKSVVDLSETNKLLGRLTADVASIRDKYVLEDALSSILDVLVGDMQTPQTQAALSSIQDVMASRFPFCVPTIVNTVLFGSILADSKAPVWEFDIAGTPLVVDFSDYGQFAEVCRWTVLLLFSASLLLNTRRFIYGMGGSSD